MAASIDVEAARAAIFDAAKVILDINRAVDGADPCSLAQRLPKPYLSPSVIGRIFQPPPPPVPVLAQAPAPKQTREEYPEVETVRSEDEESVQTPETGSVRMLENKSPSVRFNTETGAPLNNKSTQSRATLPNTSETESTVSTQSRATLPNTSETESTMSNQSANTSQKGGRRRKAVTKKRAGRRHRRTIRRY